MYFQVAFRIPLTRQEDSLGPEEQSPVLLYRDHTDWGIGVFSQVRVVGGGFGD